MAEFLEFLQKLSNETKQKHYEKVKNELEKEQMYAPASYNERIKNN